MYLKIKNKVTCYGNILSIIILTILGSVYFYFIRGFRRNNIEYIFPQEGDINSLVFIPLKIIINEDHYPYYSYFLGAPFSAEFYDYPVIWMDRIHLLCLKFLFFVIKDEFFVVGLYYILSGFMIMYISYFVLREFKIGYILSILGAITYFSIPYYILRMGHYGLVLYQFIPLVILLCYWIYKEEFVKKGKKFFIILISCLLISLTGYGYYTFYSCLLLLLTGVLKTDFRLNKIYKIKNSLLLVIFIGSLFVINLSPAIYYQYENGKNNQVMHRDVLDTELYGLKLVQMVLPSFPKTENIKEKVDMYNNIAPLVTENKMASLGFVGTIGEIVLLLSLLKCNIKDIRIKLLSRLNIFLFLWGTIGGISAIFGVFNSIFRSNNRVSIFIAFISILSMCILCEKIQNYLNEKGKRKIKNISYVSIIVIFLFGIYEQSPYKISPEAYNNISKEININKNFFNEIETVVPKNSMVYQMPYVAFPEEPGRGKMPTDEHLIPYVYTNNIRWSFGNLKGREKNSWQYIVSKFPLEDKIKILSIVGFEGIYLDTRGYEKDELIKIKEKLKLYLKVEPIESEDNKRIFYSMNRFNSDYLSNYTDEEIEQLRKQILEINVKEDYNIFSNNILRTKGFSEKNTNGVDIWRCINDKAYLEPIDNIWISSFSFLISTDNEDIYKLKLIRNNKVWREYDFDKKGTLIEDYILYKDKKETIYFVVENLNGEEVMYDNIKIRNEKIVFSNDNVIIK